MVSPYATIGPLGFPTNWKKIPSRVSKIEDRNTDRSPLAATRNPLRGHANALSEPARPVIARANALRSCTAPLSPARSSLAVDTSRLSRHASPRIGRTNTLLVHAGARVPPAPAISRMSGPVLWAGMRCLGRQQRFTTRAISDRCAQVLSFHPPDTLIGRQCPLFGRSVHFFGQRCPLFLPTGTRPPPTSRVSQGPAEFFMSSSALAGRSRMQAPMRARGRMEKSERRSDFDIRPLARMADPVQSELERPV